MCICVYGAGAIGGSLAARLAHAGAQVAIVARGVHARAIAERGLTLLSGEQEIQVRVPCVDPAHCDGLFDGVFVAVKSASLPALAPQLGRMLKPNGRLVFAMNGLPWWFPDGLLMPQSATLAQALDPGGLMRRHVDLRQVVGCVVNSSSEVIAPGVILNSTPQRNRLILGRPDGLEDPQLEAIAALLRSAGYEAPSTPSIREALWHKMLLAVAAGPVAALTGSDLGRLAGDADVLALMVQIMQEGALMGRQLGLQVPGDALDRLLFFRGLTTRPSLLQDFEAGRTPEIDNSILAFSLIAGLLKVPSPALNLVAGLIRVKRQAA